MKPHLLLSVRLAIAVAILCAVAGGVAGYENHRPLQFIPVEQNPRSGQWVDADPQPASLNPVPWAAYAGALKWGSFGGCCGFLSALAACLLLRHTWHFLLARIADLSGAIRGERPDLDDP
jgi:hypothetical protein